MSPPPPPPPYTVTLNFFVTRGRFSRSLVFVCFYFALSFVFLRSGTDTDATAPPPLLPPPRAPAMSIIQAPQVAINGGGGGGGYDDDDDDALSMTVLRRLASEAVRSFLQRHATMLAVAAFDKTQCAGQAINAHLADCAANGGKGGGVVRVERLFVPEVVYMDGDDFSLRRVSSEATPVSLPVSKDECCEFEQMIRDNTDDVDERARTFVVRHRVVRVFVDDVLEKEHFISAYKSPAVQSPPPLQSCN